MEASEAKEPDGSRRLMTVRTGAGLRVASNKLRCGGHLARLVRAPDDLRLLAWLPLGISDADWGTGGPEFKSRRSDQLNQTFIPQA